MVLTQPPIIVPKSLPDPERPGDLRVRVPVGGVQRARLPGGRLRPHQTEERHARHGEKTCSATTTTDSSPSRARKKPTLMLES